MMARKSGKIINMCSMMSELGRPTVGAYAAAKGGLKILTKNMASEWAKYNIQINGIGPWYFATEQTAPIRVEGLLSTNLFSSAHLPIAGETPKIWKEPLYFPHQKHQIL